MTTIELNGQNYLDVDWKGGKNPVPVHDVVIIDSKQLVENTEECLKQVKDWYFNIRK